MRARELGIRIGDLEPAEHNAITDVADIRVGHLTVVRDDPVIRTGVTVIVPRAGAIWENYAFCGWHSFNGNGEMTGVAWLDESGLLGSPIALTNTHQVGLVRDALVRYWVDRSGREGFLLPVVTETYDGWLSEAEAFALTDADVREALDGARSGPVDEGSVGGGTGMICFEFKGGIGSASRRVTVDGSAFTLGVLVQANFGDRHQLRINGIPVGRMIDYPEVPSPYGQAAPPGGSVVAVIATDAPLIPVQCRRLARRATVGVARVGGVGHNGSGDLFIAFSTGNHLPQSGTWSIEMLRHDQMDPLFEAVADACEEAIINALCGARSMVGRLGRTAHALPVDRLADCVATSGTSRGSAPAGDRSGVVVPDGADRGPRSGR